MRANVQTETGPLPVEMAFVDKNSRPRRVRLRRIRRHPVSRLTSSAKRHRREEADMAGSHDLHRHDASADTVGDYSALDSLHPS